MKSLLISILFIIPIISTCQLYPVTIKNDSGVIIQTGFIDDHGEKEGEWVSYGPPNIIRGIGYYKDNNKIGTWRTFKDNGIIWSELTYKNGERVHGKIFDDYGQVVEERCF
jgi:antitoxin component YwqK of YwqJK toxin-antitoxin module